MLSALVAYYEQLTRDHQDEVAPIGWSTARVSYVAQINENGKLMALIPLADRKSMALIVPAQVKRAVNIASNFLCDNSSYFLGLDLKGKPDRTDKCYKAASDLHHAILGGIDSPSARAVLSYFESPHPSMDDPVISQADEKILAGGNIVFKVDAGGQLLDPLDDPEIREAWEHHLNTGDPSSVMRCLVTGKSVPIARLHPSIKGIYGAKPSGASLVSFNARAFESYGHAKEQGRNAPVGEYAAQAYATALNYLLADSSHHTRLGNTTIVYWSERKDSPNTQAFSFLMGVIPSDASGSKEDAGLIVDATMKAIANGTYRDLQDVDLDATFHVLGLAPSDARLSVKFYFKDSFGTMLDNLGKHYRRSEVAVNGTHDRARFTPYQLLRGVEQPKAKKPVVTPILSGPLLQAMLEDAPYPQALYSNALLRIHATQEDPDNHVYKVTRARAAIVRAYLIKNCANKGYDEEGLTVGLNENRNETAYCLGRAFALLEQIQEEANGKATITNRYFNAASTTPLAVFPSIIRLSDAHLTKLGRKKAGLAISLKQQLHTVLGEGRVEVFPKRLSLEEQGDFILGYIHQRNKRYERKKSDTNIEAIDNKEE